MAQAIRDVFARAKEAKKGVFVAFTTVGYPKKESTVEVMMGLERGGAEIIELGVPYSDPLADGPTIQVGHDFTPLEVALYALSETDVVSDM